MQLQAVRPPGVVKVRRWVETGYEVGEVLTTTVGDDLEVGRAIAMGTAKVWPDINVSILRFDDEQLD